MAENKGQLSPDNGKSRSRELRGRGRSANTRQNPVNRA